MEKESGYLSAGQVARLAGVTPSTVKRWADEGALPCVKTAGRHRRFALTDIERFRAMQADVDAAAASEARAWVRTILHPEPYLLLARLYSSRARLGQWCAVADEIGAGLSELGDRWQQGKVSVLEEHIASERVERAIAQVAAELSAGRKSPRALLVAAQGEEHTLGLSLAELTIREAGWQVVWAGRSVPRPQLLSRIRSGELSLVAISASSFSKRSTLFQQAKVFAATCAKRNLPLVLGGKGDWPTDLPGTVRLKSFRALSRFLLPLQPSA